MSRRRRAVDGEKPQGWFKGVLAALVVAVLGAGSAPWWIDRIGQRSPERDVVVVGNAPVTSDSHKYTVHHAQLRITPDEQVSFEFETRPYFSEPISVEGSPWIQFRVFDASTDELLFEPAVPYIRSAAPATDKAPVTGKLQEQGVTVSELRRRKLRLQIVLPP